MFENVKYLFLLLIIAFSCDSSTNQSQQKNYISDTTIRENLREYISLRDTLISMEGYFLTALVENTIFVLYSNCGLNQTVKCLIIAQYQQYHSIDISQALFSNCQLKQQNHFQLKQSEKSLRYINTMILLILSDY
jgi:hypothetical protein